MFETEAELKERVSKLPRVFVVTGQHEIGEFSSSMSFDCSEIHAAETR